MRSGLPLIALLGLIGLAPYSIARADEPVTAEPLQRLAYSDAGIYGIALAPDGKTLYVQLTDDVINLWAIPIMYWPELGGLATALAVLFAIARLRRVMRYPQQPGQPYCRRCGYCLVGCPSDKCPECGVPARTPIIGRTFRRRVWMPLTLCVLVAGPYLAAHSLHAPRQGRLSNALECWSPGLYEWVQRHNLSTYFPKPISFVGNIVAVDTTSGAERYRLPKRRLHLDWLAMHVTADGSGLLVREQNSGDMLLLDAKTGRVRGRLSGIHCPPFRERQYVGSSSDGQTVFVWAYHYHAGKTRLLAWRPQTGKSDSLLELDCEIVYGAPALSMPHKLTLIRSDPPMLFDGFPGPQTRPPREHRVWSISDRPRVVTRIEADDYVYAAQVWPEGNRVYLCTQSDQGYESRSYDLLTGKCVGHIRSACLENTPPRVVAGRLVAMRPTPSGSPELALWDVRDDRWVANLPLPDDFRSLEDTRVSDDGRWLAAHIVLDHRDAYYPRIVLVYDLGQLANRTSGPH